MTANLATNWYQWQVLAEETNLTEPYVFHMVNARGTTYEQTQQGFWSTSFYILRDETVSSGSSSSSTSTSSSTLSSSSTADLASGTIFSTTATATIDSTSTSAASTDLAPAATQVNHDGLSTGGISGIAAAGVVVAILLGFAGLCYGRQKVHRVQPAVVEPTIQMVEPAPAYWEYQAPPQEINGHPVTAQEQKPVYELPPGRN
ncbi:hypothetical protein SCUP515_10227 [Seiridium cupressi]